MSRLYPGWGSGKEQLELQLVAQPFSSIDRADMEAGDKVIMPQAAFKQVSRMKLPFPLTFEVTNPRVTKRMNNAAAKKTNTNPGTNKAPVKKGTKSAAAPSTTETKPGSKDEKPKTKVIQQYCGVMEFSAPDETIYMPRWMMRNLRVKEGQTVQINSLANTKLVKGTFCKLQPHESAFVEMAGSMDIRDLFEQSFRNYSALTKGETIVVSCFGVDYKIDVIDTQPAEAISLYGNLDLEVDFAPPLDTPEGASGNHSSRDMEGDRSRYGSNVHGVGSLGKNQSPSPINGHNDKNDDEAGHSWGPGASLNGSAAASEGSNSLRQRKVAQYATRTQGVKFGGVGNTIASNGSTTASAGSSAGSVNTAAQSTAIVAAQSVGRRLQGGDSEEESKTAVTEAVVPKAEDMRLRRMKFLENLAANKPGEAADVTMSSPRIAVGSSLNAIRRAKNPVTA